MNIALQFVATIVPGHREKKIAASTIIKPQKTRTVVVTISIVTATTEMYVNVYSGCNS